MKNKGRAWALVLGILLWAPVLHAEEPSAGEVSQMAMEVSQEVFSPFCPGKTLAMCPSPAAAEVRRDIQDMAREGLAKDEIKARVIKEYGEEFRLVEPPLTDNLGLLSAVAGGLGLAGFAVWMISRRRKDEPSDAAETTPTPSKKDGGTDGAEDPYINELRSQYRD